MRTRRILREITGSLNEVTHPRYFRTERPHYQGHLAHRLSLREWGAGVIVEEEFQKTLAVHGFGGRPDISIHIPTIPLGDVTRGNLATIALKLSATAATADEDFRKLDVLLEELHYRVGVFVNIAGESSFAETYSGPNLQRLHFFAVSRKGSAPVVRHTRLVGRDLVASVRRCVTS